MSTSLTKKEPQGISSMIRDPFHAMRDEMDALLTRFWPEGGSGLIAAGAVPKLDLAETDVAVEVRMDLPGMKADDIRIDVQQNLITISGERKEEKVENGNGRSFHRVERRSGSFSRTVTLPCTVLTDKIEATYHDGVLSVNLPKAEPTKTRTVKVKPI